MLLMWTDHLSCGVEDFDDDHKRLIRMINELHGVILDVNAKGMIAEEEIEIAVHRLQNYFEYHCLQEEKVMAETSYLGLNEHKREHVIFFDTVAEMSTRFRGSADPKDAVELMQFMYDWLTNHIYATDKKFASHLHSQGIF